MFSQPHHVGSPTHALHASHMGLLPVLLICLETLSPPFVGQALPILPFTA